MGLAILGSTYEARAELGSQFAGKITVDAEYAPGVGAATDIAWAADGRAVITRRTGQVVIRRTDGTLKSIDYPFPGPLDTSFGEKGLLGVVADPNVATNNTFYFYMTNGPSNADKQRVYKAVLTDDDNLMVTMTPVVGGAGTTPTLEGPLNHNGGGMIVHKGQLYIGVGDSGSNSSPPTNKYGSCLNKGNGKILRVNMDGTVPMDNPLVGMTSVTSCMTTKNDNFAMGAPDQRIYAWGLRNPWRFWLDPQTDLMWIGDVGEQLEEEISVGKGGEHFGYPFFEGKNDHEGGTAQNNPLKGMDCNDITPARDCTAPVYTYPTNKGAVIGGLIPGGCGWDKALGGTFYLFADSDKDWIRALPVNAQRTGVSSTTPVDFDTYKSGNPSPVSFRMGPDQSLYVAMNGAGAIYRYTPTDRTGPDCDGGSGGGGAGGTAGAGGNSSGGQGLAGVAGAPAAGGPAGGSAPVAGAAGAAGVPVAGASGSPSGVAGSPAQGGSAPVGGAPQVAGGPAAGAAGGGGSGDDGGCGCRVSGGSTRTALWAAAAAGLAGFAWRRRRRKKKDGSPPDDST